MARRNASFRPVGSLAAEATVVRAQGPQKPGTTARPRPVVGAQSAKPLPSFMQGAQRAAAGRGGPAGNASDVLATFKAPEHTTSMIRGASGLQPSYGPVVGPRPGQFVAALQGIDGFSFSKLTSWVSNTVAAVASKDPAAIMNQVAAAVPGSKTPSKPPPVQPVQAVPAQPSPSVFYNQMVPQNDTQKMMLMGAGVLGLGLVAMMVMRRR